MECRDGKKPDWSRVLGENVRRARTARGWSQQELADRADVAQRTVSFMERGENSTLASIIAIAGAFKISPILLMMPGAIGDVTPGKAQAQLEELINAITTLPPAGKAQLQRLVEREQVYWRDRDDDNDSPPTG